MTTSTLNRKTFYDYVRPRVFNGTLKQTQVGGMEVILNEWERRQLSQLKWLAYMFATPYVETAQTMMPIHEYGDDAYFTRLYDIRGAYPERARSMGNIYPGDGTKYCGRGFVQLTWRINYHKMTGLIGKFYNVDLEADPDKAMVMPIACSIMFEGMLRADSHVGDFTGKALEDYLDDNKSDWNGARYVINGQDRAAEIGGIAQVFYAGLQAANQPVIWTV